jgi:hypothetical protein
MEEGADTMIMVGCDFHPGFEELAVPDPQTGPTSRTGRPCARCFRWVVRMGAIYFQLHGKNEAPEETMKALAALKFLGQEPTASGIILLMVSEAFRRAEPSSLRDANVLRVSFPFISRAALLVRLLVGVTIPKREYRLGDDQCHLKGLDYLSNSY